MNYGMPSFGAYGIASSRTPDVPDFTAAAARSIPGAQVIPGVPPPTYDPVVITYYQPPQGGTGVQNLPYPQRPMVLATPTQGGGALLPWQRYTLYAVAAGAVIYGGSRLLKKRGR